MARKDPQINIRIPTDLKAHLERVAVEGGRSVTAEIITRLQASFQAPMDLKREQLMLFINEAIDERLELMAQQSSPASQAVEVLVRDKQGRIKIPEMDTGALVLSDGPKRAQLIGNIGRDATPAAPAGPANKGPVKRTRGQPKQ